MEIRKYDEQLDYDKVMNIIEIEGEEWSDYSGLAVRDKYKRALKNSITYVAYSGDEVCGYSRSVNDNDYYIYVCDLLVTPKYRGKKIGKELMEAIYNDYPEIMAVFVMSDVDDYYKKQGYKLEGSIFEVNRDN